MNKRYRKQVCAYNEEGDMFVGDYDILERELGIKWKTIAKALRHNKKSCGWSFIQAMKWIYIAYDRETGKEAARADTLQKLSLKMNYSINWGGYVSRTHGIWREYEIRAELQLTEQYKQLLQRLS